MQIRKTVALGQIAPSAEEFLRSAPKPVDPRTGWPGSFEDGSMVGDLSVVRAPIPRPSVEQLAADFAALAGTDTPQREYPGEFFTRDVIYDDRG